MNGISLYNRFSRDWQAPESGVDQGRSNIPAEEAAAAGEPAEEGKGRSPASATQDRVTLSPEAQQQLREMSARDREVRAHEAAHAAAGGPYAGAPRLRYERGPDGRRYAVAGEVNIDVSEVPGDPKKTLEKARVIKRAAQAPANPSAADRAIATKAAQMAAGARKDIATEKNEELKEKAEKSLPAENPSEKKQGSMPGQPIFRSRGQLLDIAT